MTITKKAMYTPKKSKKKRNTTITVNAVADTTTLMKSTIMNMALAAAVMITPMKATITNTVLVAAVTITPTKTTIMNTILVAAVTITPMKAMTMSTTLAVAVTTIPTKDMTMDTITSMNTVDVVAVAATKKWNQNITTTPTIQKWQNTKTMKWTSWKAKKKSKSTNAALSDISMTKAYITRQVIRKIAIAIAA